MPDCPRKSEMTLSRERLAWRKLAAQGFTTLPDFFMQKAEKLAEKEKCDTRLAVLVAAATTQPSSRQERPCIQQEEEMSGDEITAEEGNPKIASTLHINKHTLETSATSDMAQPCSLDGATMSCVVETTSKTIQIEDDDKGQSEPSGTAGGFSSQERPCTPNNHSPSDSRPCSQAPPPFKVLEESSSCCCKTLSDNNKPDSELDPEEVLGSGCPPSKKA